METISGSTFLLRPVRPSDAEALASYADNRKIWENVKDAFPHPYTVGHARDFIEYLQRHEEEIVFAIDVEGEMAGSIGLKHKTDVYRINRELGFWLGEPFWGRGIVSEAVNLVVDYGFRQTEALRIYAEVYAHNRGSMRVLERNGFRREAVLRQAVIKDEKIEDLHIFALLKSEWETGNIAF